MKNIYKIGPLIAILAFNSGFTFPFSFWSKPACDLIEGNDSFTELLLSFDGTAGDTFTTDESASAHPITFGSSAQIIAGGKFSTAMGPYFSFTDHVRAPASSDWAFGTGDFTIDFWTNWAGAPAGNGFRMVGGVNGAGGWTIGNDNGGNLIFYSGAFGTALVNTSTAFSTGIWYHIAFIRSGTNLCAYVDGVLQGSCVTNSTNFTNNSNQLYIGTDGTYLNYNAAFDEYRISKGIARWTSAFTPPIGPYTLPCP